MIVLRQSLVDSESKPRPAPQWRGPRFFCRWEDGSRPQGQIPEAGRLTIRRGGFVLDTRVTRAYYRALQRSVTGDGFYVEEHRAKGFRRSRGVPVGSGGPGRPG
jgi:hypothetical protein